MMPQLTLTCSGWKEITIEEALALSFMNRRAHQKAIKHQIESRIASKKPFNNTGSTN